MNLCEYVRTYVGVFFEHTYTNTNRYTDQTNNSNNRYEIGLDPLMALNQIISCCQDSELSNDKLKDVFTQETQCADFSSF